MAMEPECIVLDEPTAMLIRTAAGSHPHGDRAE